MVRIRREILEEEYQRARRWGWRVDEEGSTSSEKGASRDGVDEAPGDESSSNEERRQLLNPSQPSSSEHEQERKEDEGDQAPMQVRNSIANGGLFSTTICDNCFAKLKTLC